MELKENIQDAKNHMSAWWDHEIINRPIIGYTYRKFNFKSSVPYSSWDLAKNNDAIEIIYDKFIRNSTNQKWGAEMFPNFWPNYGPGIMAAVFGCEPEYKNSTVWFHHPISLDDIVPLLESAQLNSNNKWYARLLQVTQFVAERSNGQFSVGMSDIGGVLDILSSFLGPTEIIIAMRRNPGIIDTCRSIILEKLINVYDDLQNIIDNYNLGCNGWLNVWCPKRYYTIQCDFAAMLSPKYFKRFALPDIITQAEHLDYAIYHLDGPNEIPHIADLLAEPSITGIQWVPGIGQPSTESEKWFPLYNKIQDAEKNLVLDCSPFGISYLYKKLKPVGLFVRTYTLNRIIAKMYLPKFIKGWGDFFGRKPSKLGEDMMIVKNKFRLKIMNAAHSM
ncbi:MAG: hypothetical protein JW776_08675 [Candidatus Lokiarchaeota archaeon]|nr:hypothetical protein [Candidatus Lokiarchaeota archaeon]